MHTSCSPACIAKFSSGQIYYHSDFHCKNKVSTEKFEEDLKYALSLDPMSGLVSLFVCTTGGT